MTDWESIVAEHARPAWQTAYRIVSSVADADDCMQEAFVAAVKLSRRQRVLHWGGLLHRLATTKALDQLRRRRRESARRENLPDFSALAGDSAAPGQRAEQAELAEVLRRALAALPARQAEVFCLRVLSEMTFETIARELGVSAANVRVILHRARSRLRELLGGYRRSQAELRCRP